MAKRRYRPIKIDGGPTWTGEWPGARSAPKIAQKVSKIGGLGKVRSRCNKEENVCVLEFDRAPKSKHHEVMEVLEKEGFEVIDSGTAVGGTQEFASEVRIKYNKNDG